MDSSVAFGAVDEGRPGKRAAEDTAGAQNKMLKNGFHAREEKAGIYPAGKK